MKYKYYLKLETFLNDILMCNSLNENCSEGKTFKIILSKMKLTPFYIILIKFKEKTRHTSAHRSLYEIWWWISWEQNFFNSFRPYAQPKPCTKFHQDIFNNVNCSLFTRFTWTDSKIDVVKIIRRMISKCRLLFMSKCGIT